MTQFVSPLDRFCPATVDGHIRCELEPHDGHLHRNGPLLWHEPPLILIDGAEPDLNVETERWQNGRVLLFDEVEPDLEETAP